MQKIFDTAKCQNTATRIAKVALEECTTTLGVALSLADSGEGHLRGTENMFDKAFEAAAGHHLFKSKATTGEMGVPESVMQAKGTSRGMIDCVLDFDGHLIGFEHKVVRLPRRKNNHPYGVLYDLGQITIDHYRLEMARKLSGGYCTVILHGPLVEDAKDDEGVYRHFWNSMFLDYSVSINWGELADEKSGNMSHDSRKWQLANIKRLYFHKPYAIADRPMDFRVRNKDKTLAVIGIWAKRRGRLPNVSN